MKNFSICTFIYIISVVLAFSYGMEYARVTTSPPKDKIVYIEKPIVEKQDDLNEIVYITKTGKRYHQPDCPYLKNPIETTLYYAKAARYTPCSMCSLIK